MAKPVAHALTVAAQRKAADPRGSAWVSANAGSGKTWVLARRVIRLLLTGTPPDRILCLTFTRAAAATMSNRVFTELGRWTLLDDAALTVALFDLDGLEPKPTHLARARRLFAEAIETPGGLKIQTIHAFCESLLQRFPLEADLGGAFDILDEASEREAIAEARARVLVAASAAAPGDPLAAALARLLAEVGEHRLGNALDQMIAARDDLRRWLREVDDLAGCRAALEAGLGVRPGDDDAALAAEMLASPDFPAALLSRLADDLAASGANDRKQAERIGRARDPALDVERRIEAWRSVFLTDKGTPRKSLAARAIADRHPDLGERAARETARLAALADRRAALATRDATLALLVLGDRMIGVYEAAKRTRGALDFDDLVGRAADLLSRSDAARWVQYKLDQGIDHILVDEAQDTAPRAWAIVHALTEEFFAGEGARNKHRTVFAVGDEKQSIYSFQGASPRAFSDNRRAFARAAEAAQETFSPISLFESFRSTGDVLAAVDRVFADPDRRAAVVAEAADYTAHTAARRVGGLVEVWPPETAIAEDEPEDWTLPLDRPGPAAPWQRLAKRIADEIERLIATDARPADAERPLSARDVLVLVRRRGPFVDAMNRVLKERGIAAAGQDRMRLTDHIAVADLIALGRALLLPEDDLSLAAALKSPLFGLGDDDLTALAAAGAKERGLAATLADAAEPRLAAAAARFGHWRDLARRLPAFELFTRILAADGGRRHFLERLGREADDVLDEFLSLALASDAGPAPSLVRFLEDLAADAPEIKRDLDETRDEVRVMTVHGAKGLEASVVFLVDSGAAPVHARHDPALVRLARPDAPPGAAPALVWSLGAADPVAVTRLRDAHREAARAEYLRLLYVAMTRAADRLYVCGWAPKTGEAEACWRRVVDDALAAEAETVTDAAGEVVARRWRREAAAPIAPVVATAAAPPPAVGRALPGWIARAPAGAVPPRRLLPSRVVEDDGPPRVAATDRLAAAESPRDHDLARGLLVHRLLEATAGLDEADRRPLAERLAAVRAGPLAAADRDRAVAEALAVLADPAFAAVFAAGSRAEVPIVGRLKSRDGDVVEVSGRIDRLVVTPAAVLVVDFKTDRHPPSFDRLAASHVAQLALYRHLLGRLHRDRPIRVALLWTVLPRLDEVPEALLAAALADLALT